MGSSYSLWKEPDVTPMGDDPPSFPPNYGFEKGRKPRGNENILTSNFSIVLFN